MIRARAPLRISFGGGGTDVPPYPEKYGGTVLSAAIDRYAYCTVEEADSFKAEKGTFEEAVAKLYSWGKPFILHSFSEVPPGSGLGSSSALVVAMIKAASRFESDYLGPHKLAEMAFDLERVKMGIKGGYQDQYGSAFGGFNFIRFEEQATVTRIEIEPDVLNELQASLLLIDTGRTRFSGNVLSRQIASYEAEVPSVLEALGQLKLIARAMMSTLTEGDIPKFAELLGEDWHWKKQLDSSISNGVIDELYLRCLQEGALSGKVLGAGDGGHMLFFVPLERRMAVLKFLASRGYPSVPFGFDFDGATTWKPLL